MLPSPNVSCNANSHDTSNEQIIYKRIIHLDHWRKGYTTEALTKLLDFGFNELKLHRIEAGCAIENIASNKVLEKVGMTKEGIKRKILPIRGMEGQLFLCYFR